MNHDPQTETIAASDPTVHIVDDDMGLLDGLAFLVRAAGFHALTYSSGEQFLSAMRDAPGALDGDGCILLDLRLLGLQGDDVFRTLHDIAPSPGMPVLFLSGHGDIPTASALLKQGAYDFLEKPVSGDALIGRLNGAFAESRRRRSKREHIRRVHERIGTLTRREFSIMGLLYEGATNRDAAQALGVTVRTIEVHRAKVYEKLGVHSIVRLVRLLESVDWAVPRS